MYFPEDETVSIVSEKAVLNCSKMSRGAECMVKERSKCHRAKVLEIGKSKIIIIITEYY